jgi:hypothetical protein
MVGALKQLIDHAAAADIRAGGSSIDAYPIESILVTAGLAFIQKID